MKFGCIALLLTPLRWLSVRSVECRTMYKHFIVLLYDVLWPSLCIMFKYLFFSFIYIWTCWENGLRCRKGKSSKHVIFIIMFPCAYTKSFASHCNNAMCVVMSITFESYIWVYIKETLLNEPLYNARVLTFRIYGGTCLCEVPGKYAANGIDSCGSSCTINK